jgi:hypothetical protein
MAGCQEDYSTRKALYEILQAGDTDALLALLRSPEVCRHVQDCAICLLNYPWMSVRAMFLKCSVVYIEIE